MELTTYSKDLIRTLKERISFHENNSEYYFSQGENGIARDENEQLRLLKKELQQIINELPEED